MTCPVALYPATSDAEKISFNQINKKTGHRIRYVRVDGDTGEEVANEDIIKGYEVDKDTYLEVTKDELENIALDERLVKPDQEACYSPTKCWANKSLAGDRGASRRVAATGSSPIA